MNGIVVFSFGIDSFAFCRIASSSSSSQKTWSNVVMRAWVFVVAKDGLLDVSSSMRRTSLKKESES